MHSVKIRGVTVDFPFSPYPLQVNYMEKVIECLQEEKNGILESPTGTGKTLSLLCSSLAWLEMKKAECRANRVGLDTTFLKECHPYLRKSSVSQSATQSTSAPTIIYTSRTHSQLKQAMNELKKTKYKYMKASALGSRDQMCIHEEVLKADTTNAKIQMCRTKVKNRTCYFYSQVEKKLLDPAISEYSIMDIEDLVKLGQKHKFCPYYMSRDLRHKADIVFMPYNYVLDPKIRKTFNLDLNNSIIILDEAHNVEKVCEESASFQLKSTDLALAISEVTDVMKMLENDGMEFTDQDFTVSDLLQLKSFFMGFERELNCVKLAKPKEGVDFKGSHIFEMFKKAGISFHNYNSYICTMEKIVQYLTVVSSANNGPSTRTGSGLQLIADLIGIAFLGSNNPDIITKIDRCCKVHIGIEQNWIDRSSFSVSSRKSQTRVLSYWCLNPGFGMNMLMNLGVKCVILTSGTLAPLKPLISELELNIQVQLENPHIINADQAFVKIVPVGPDNEELICNFQNRENPAFLTSLGRTIRMIVQFIPHGVLIFFPSYPVMQNCQKFWQTNNIWTDINKIKPVLVEPKDKQAFNLAMNEYYSKINDPACKGAIFMGVCRGKLSEGLDFADANGRTVIIVGLPYAPFKDPKIVLKKQYLNNCHSRDRAYCSGDEWYNLEACRAVNQAIGRVIRHREDYGAILFLDKRFNQQEVKRNLSKWLHNHIKVVRHYNELNKGLKTFFKDLGEKYPVILPKEETEICEDLSFASDSAIFDSYSVSQPTSSSSQLSLTQESINENILKRPRISDGTENIQITKKPLFSLTPSAPNPDSEFEKREFKSYNLMVKQNLDFYLWLDFLYAWKRYKKRHDLRYLCWELDKVFYPLPHKRHLLIGLEDFITDADKEGFRQFLRDLDSGNSLYF